MLLTYVPPWSGGVRAVIVAAPRRWLPASPPVTRGLHVILSLACINRFVNKRKSVFGLRKWADQGIVFKVGAQLWLLGCRAHWRDGCCMQGVEAVQDGTAGSRGLRCVQQDVGACLGHVWDGKGGVCVCKAQCIHAHP